ncbi:Outer membrane protein (porin) [Nitrincola lacisaponensis]|uniref:Outer membrane protein (Porin) n=1 Tax=Nitrincola lacisaponensis TaxID=267850 RepID=A0A063Y8F8_9GAMM|nr:porin [Nitrincola lacisaponensis]KDE41006.1 Outer membrane protein (porin) [Nitrincola lacisaponensis]
MKKSIIALAVAGAMTVPAIASADATLYGHIMMGVDKEKGEKLHIGSSANSESRIGLRGTADTGVDGLTALYHYEFGVRTNQTGYGAGAENALRTRLANVGLTGDWGTAVLGTQWAPHYSWVTSTTDVMLSSVVNPTHSTDTVYRVNNTAAYVSPNLNGLQLAAAVSASSANDDTTGDFYHVAAKYSIGDFYVAASHIDFKADAFEAAIGDKVTAVAASYSFGPLTVAGVYSYLKLDGEDNYKPWDLAATYAVTDATTLKVAYADFKNSQKGYGFEVQHDLSNMVNTFVGYGRANSNLRDTYAATDGDEGANSVFSTGIRVRF